MYKYIVSIPERDYKVLRPRASAGDGYAKKVLFQSLKGIIRYCDKIPELVAVAVKVFQSLKGIIRYCDNAWRLLGVSD